MKKKFLVVTSFIFSVIFIGFITVNAATQVALPNTPVNIKSGKTYNSPDLYAQYPDAMATLTIDTVTSGKAINEWVSYVYSNGSYQPKFSVTGGITRGICKRVNLGKVGAGGTFRFVDFAYDILTDDAWAGWAGSVEITTS